MVRNDSVTLTNPQAILIHLSRQRPSGEQGCGGNSGELGDVGFATRSTANSVGTHRELPCPPGQIFPALVRYGSDFMTDSQDM